MFTRAGLVAALFLAACGGTTMPVDDAGATLPSLMPAPLSDAATVAPDADVREADAGSCWACAGVGWWNACEQTLGSPADSCAKCGVSCPVDASAD